VTRGSRSQDHEGAHIAVSPLVRDSSPVERDGIGNEFTGEAGSPSAQDAFVDPDKRSRAQQPSPGESDDENAQRPSECGPEDGSVGDGDGGYDHHGHNQEHRSGPQPLGVSRA